MRTSTKTNRAIRIFGASLAASTYLACAVLSTNALAQEALNNGTVAPMGQWLEFIETAHEDKPILIHLRTGYERAIVFPEAVVLQDSNKSLPGCEIIINENIISLYPTETYKRRSVLFTGKQSGTVYDLHIRASTSGVRQPLRINSK